MGINGGKEGKKKEAISPANDGSEVYEEVVRNQVL